MADNIIQKPDTSTSSLDKPLDELMAEAKEEKEEAEKAKAEAEKAKKAKEEAEKDENVIDYDFQREDTENTGEPLELEDNPDADYYNDFNSYSDTEFSNNQEEIIDYDGPSANNQEEIIDFNGPSANNQEEIINFDGPSANAPDIEEKSRTKKKVKVPIASTSEQQKETSDNILEKEKSAVTDTKDTEDHNEEEIDTQGLSYTFTKDERGRNVLKLLRQCSADEILKPGSYCGNDKKLIADIENKLKEIDVIEIGNSEQPDIKFDVFADLMSAVRTVNTTNRLVGVNFVGDNINFHDCQITDCLAPIPNGNERNNENIAHDVQMKQFNAMEKFLFDWENSDEFIEYTNKFDNLTADIAVETNDIAKVADAGVELLPFIKAEYRDQITDALKNNEEYENIVAELKKQGLAEDTKVSLLSDKERVEKQITGIFVKKLKDEIKPEVLFEDIENPKFLIAIKQLENAENFTPKNIEERFKELEGLKKNAETKFKELHKGELGNIEDITIENVLRRAQRLKIENEKARKAHDEFQKAPIAYEMNFMCAKAPVCGKNDREVGFCEKSHSPVFVSFLGNKNKEVVSTGDFFLSDANIFGTYVDPKVDIALGKGAMARGDIRGLIKMMKEHEGDPKFISDHCADYLKGADYQNDEELRKYALLRISEYLNKSIQEAKNKKNSFDNKVIAEQIKEMKSLDNFLKDFDKLTKNAKKPIEKEKVLAQVSLMKKAAESYTEIFTKENLKLKEFFDTIPNENKKLDQTSSDKLRSVLDKVLAVRTVYEKESWINRGRNTDDSKYKNNLEFRGYMDNNSYLNDKNAKDEFIKLNDDPFGDSLNSNCFHFDMKPPASPIAKTQITVKMVQAEGSKQQKLDIISSQEAPLEFSVYNVEGKEIVNQEVFDSLNAKLQLYIDNKSGAPVNEMLKIIDSLHVATGDELKEYEEFKAQALKQIKDAAKYIPENNKELTKYVAYNNNEAELKLENYKYCKSAIEKFSNDYDSKEIISELNKRENDIEKAESKYVDLKNDESILNVLNSIDNQINDMEETLKHTKDMLDKGTYANLENTTIMECDSAGCTAGVGAFAGQNLFKLRTKKVNMDASLSNIYQQKGQLLKNINVGNLILLDKIRNNDLSFANIKAFDTKSLEDLAKIIAETKLPEFIIENKKIIDSKYGKINKEIKKYEKAIRNFIALNKNADKQDVKMILDILTNGNNDLEWDNKIERIKLAEYLDRMENVSKNYKGKTVTEYKKGASFEEASYLNTTSNTDGISIKSNTDEYLIKRKEIENAKSEATAIVNKLAHLTNVSILSIRNAEDVENLKKSASKYRDELEKELITKQNNCAIATTVVEGLKKDGKTYTSEFLNNKNEKNRLNDEIQKIRDDINNINLLLYKEAENERFKDDSLNKSEIDKAIDVYREYAYFVQYNSSETQYDINHNSHALTLEKERAELVKALGGKANMKNGRAEIIEEPIRTEQNKEKFDRLVKVNDDLRQIWSDGGTLNIGNFAQPSGLKNGDTALILGNVKISKFAINGKAVRQYSDGIYKVLGSNDKSLKKLEMAHKYYMAVGGVKAIATTMAKQTIGSLEHFTVTRAMAFAVIAIAMAAGKTITWATQKGMNEIRKDSLSKNATLLAMANIMKDPKYANMTPDKMLSSLKTQGLIDFTAETDKITVKIREIPDVPNDVKRVLNNTIARKGYTTYSFSKDDIYKLIENPEYQEALTFAFARRDDKVEKYEENRRIFWSGLKNYADKRNMVDNDPSQILGKEKATVIERPIGLRPGEVESESEVVAQKVEEAIENIEKKETQDEETKIEEKPIATSALGKESVIEEKVKDTTTENKNEETKIEEKPIATPASVKESVIEEKVKDATTENTDKKEAKDNQVKDATQKVEIILDPVGEIKKEAVVIAKDVSNKAQDKIANTMKEAKEVKPQPVTVASSKADFKKNKTKAKNSQSQRPNGQNNKQTKNSPRGSNNRGKMPKNSGGRGYGRNGK